MASPSPGWRQHRVDGAMLRRYASGTTEGARAPGREPRPVIDLDVADWQTFEAWSSPDGDAAAELVRDYIASYGS